MQCTIIVFVSILLQLFTLNPEDVVSWILIDLIVKFCFQVSRLGEECRNSFRWEELLLIDKNTIWRLCYYMSVTAIVPPVVPPKGPHEWIYKCSKSYRRHVQSHTSSYWFGGQLSHLERCSNALIRIKMYKNPKGRSHK